MEHFLLHLRGFWWFLGREGDSAPSYRNRMGIRRSWKLGKVFTVNY